MSDREPRPPKEITWRRADPNGLHDPDVEHELAVGRGSQFTVIHLTDEELKILTEELAIYQLRYGV